MTLLRLNTLIAVLTVIASFSCASLHPTNHPTRAETDDEYAITYALTQYVLYCGLGGGILPPEEPEQQSKNFIEKLSDDFRRFIREEFRIAMDEDVMTQQTRILEPLHAVFGTDPKAELGIVLTPKTLEIAYPPGAASAAAKEGRIDCFPVESGESDDDLRAIREHWGTFAVHTYEDGTLEMPRATLRFDLTFFPTEDPDYVSPPLDAPRYVQPTVLHLTKDPDWKIEAFRIRAGGSD